MTDIEYLKRYYQGDINEAIKRLNNGEPVQYIVGNVDFYGYVYEVNRNVLIPRFETEELVYNTIEYLKKDFSQAKVLDLCTGSGCIGLTMKLELKDITLTLSDISEAALKIANINKNKYQIDCDIVLSDLFQNINGKFDCIISNPPYIAYDEEIMDIVKNNEPHLALYANNNGMEMYEKIFKESIKYLNEKYIMALEMNSNKSFEIVRLANKYFQDADIFTKKDNSNRDRMLFIIKK